MTQTQLNYIEKQLQIIQLKPDEEALRRYEALLSMAKLEKEVYEPLARAVDKRHKELSPIDAMVVNGDMNDIN